MKKKQLFYLFTCIALILINSSCNDNDNIPDRQRIDYDTKIQFKMDSLIMKVGDTINNLNVQCEPDLPHRFNCVWKSSDIDVVDIITTQDTYASIYAKRQGNVSLKVETSVLTEQQDRNRGAGRTVKKYYSTILKIIVE